MRILVVSHTYVVAENQKKIAALADRPGVTVEVVVPRVWRDALHGDIHAHAPEAARFTLRAVPALLTGREQFYGYLSVDLGLRRFRPDVILVEQGAGAFVYTQVLMYRACFAPQARAAFFTWWNLPYRARWPLSAIERFNLRRSDGAVAGNADAAAILRDHGFAGPLRILPQLGVDPEAFAPRDAQALKSSLGLTGFTIGFVGRIVEEKGVRVLSDALTSCAFDFQLLMVGHGPMRSTIEADAARGGWAHRLVVADAVPHDRVADYMACMNVLVLPSLTRAFWKEQFGHVLLEAMACAVPVIGSTSGEIPRVIGNAGLLVPEGDAAALRKALAELASSAALRRRLGDAGRARVLEQFTHARVAEQLDEFMRGL